MELINFLGLNCYHNCIITIANNFGLDYCSAFSNLWSETDFRYEIYRKVYLSQRLIANLELLGLKLKMMLCSSPEEAEKYLAMIDDGEFIIVGMDAFYIPWNQFYGIFHGPHYFIAKKEKSEEFLCFDPTYNKMHEQISSKDIIAYAFDISYMYTVALGVWEVDIIHEAKEILCTYESIREKILSQIMDSESGDQAGIILCAKYIDAMINNRYLFRHLLMEKQFYPDANDSLFNRDYFLEWTAIKNGMYKIAHTKTRCTIIQEVYNCFGQVIDKENAIANKILYSI